MKFKFDENIGNRCIDILLADGHDVATVVGQGMTSAADTDLIDASAAEGRALVTLDLDFSNPISFPPQRDAGIAVLRLRSHPKHANLVVAMKTLAQAVKRETLEGKLWSVEVGRIRIYQPPDPP